MAILSILFVMMMMMMMIMVTETRTLPLDHHRHRHQGYFKSHDIVRSELLKDISKDHIFDKSSSSGMFSSKEELLKKFSVAMSRRDIVQLDANNLIEVCNCDKVVKLFENVTHDVSRDGDIMGNCKTVWTKEKDEEYIPPYFYKAECQGTSDDCCQTKIGDYRCEPTWYEMHVLRKVNVPSAKEGCCFYQPAIRKVQSTCSCQQRNGNTHVPTVPMPDPNGPST